MLDKLLKYWPLVTVASLAIVSVFNVGYFSVIGLHFVGVMDLTNIVYSIGLVFGLAIAPLIAAPTNVGDDRRKFAERPDAMLVLMPPTPLAIPFPAALHFARKFGRSTP
ncbi:MAG: hypothetical protein QOF14_2077 [Hyphomicrobiales bacterium]|jgi:hypothetical protein|nr:hypothetical protein [Hyphomicrobiales bacterium]